MDAGSLATALGLEPHPEGGCFRRTFTDPQVRDGRPLRTAILFLLAGGESSRWHRIDAHETWHFLAGDPLELAVSDDGVDVRTEVLRAAPVGQDRSTSRAGVTVPPGSWQAARSLGAWTLVGCTVSPGFVFEGFELAPPGWAPAATGDDDGTTSRGGADDPPG